ncbi:hypothetical protein ECAD30_46050 [Escherichia coli AD30]|nr:hypothetical protein ECAD30_46050 [Escherichia coli AD30]
MGNKNDVMDARAIWMAVQQPVKISLLKRKRSSQFWSCTVRADNW